MAHDPPYPSLFVLFRPIFFRFFQWLGGSSVSAGVHASSSAFPMEKQSNPTNQARSCNCSAHEAQHEHPRHGSKLTHAALRERNVEDVGRPSGFFVGNRPGAHGTGGGPGGLENSKKPTEVK